MTSFFVHGIPVTQGSMVVMRNRMIHVKHKELTAWRRSIGQGYLDEGGCIMLGPVSVTLVFTLIKPKSVRRRLPSVRPDLDKFIRAALDALTGFAYVDDGQVVRIAARKRYGDFPGVDIQVGEIAYEDE